MRVTARSSSLLATSALMVLGACTGARALGGDRTLACRDLAGARLVAQDGQYLGALTSEFARGSVLNEFGPHGSEHSDSSIWNPHGRYGSEFSPLSPHRLRAPTPPRIVRGDTVLGYLSVNARLRPRVSPQRLRRCAFQSAVRPLG